MKTLEETAREAGMYFAKDDFGDVPEIETNLDQLQRFAALVRAQALDEAANMLDAEHAKRSHLDNHAAFYATKVRALKDRPPTP